MLEFVSSPKYVGDDVDPDDPNHLSNMVWWEARVRRVGDAIGPEQRRSMKIRYLMAVRMKVGQRIPMAIWPNLGKKVVGHWIVPREDRRLCVPKDYVEQLTPYLEKERTEVISPSGEVCV